MSNKLLLTLGLFVSCFQVTFGSENQIQQKPQQQQQPQVVDAKVDDEKKQPVVEVKDQKQPEQPKLTIQQLVEVFAEKLKQSESFEKEKAGLVQKIEAQEKSAAQFAEEKKRLEQEKKKLSEENAGLKQQVGGYETVFGKLLAQQQTALDSAKQLLKDEGKVDVDQLLDNAAGNDDEEEEGGEETSKFRSFVSGAGSFVVKGVLPVVLAAAAVYGANKFGGVSLHTMKKYAALPAVVFGLVDYQWGAQPASLGAKLGRGLRGLAYTAMLGSSAYTLAKK